MRTRIKQFGRSGWGIVAVCFCLIIIAAVFLLLNECSKTDSSLVLDSSISSIDASSADKLAFLRGFAPAKMEKAFIFINAGTASGISYTVAEDTSPELLEELVKMLFDSNLEYSEAAKTYEDTEYSFYVAFTNADASESITVFVFDNETIRFDGQFFVASKSLDFAPINEGLRASVR